LEDDLNLTNYYYLEKNIAVIHKKPTPIQVIKTSLNKITLAYFKEPSTTDYNGLYKGKYIDFEAKETTSKTSFPLENIHKHQIKHIRNIQNHQGIVFLIISMNDEYFILMGKDFLNFIDNETRKSIPYEYLEKNGIKINMTLKGLDYLSKLKEII
jgi:recombination protein U